MARFGPTPSAPTIPEPRLPQLRTPRAATHIHALLRREGATANVKRVHRLYKLEQLQVKNRHRRHGVAVERRPLQQVPMAPNEVWSMDFVSDSLEYGRRLKCLTIVDHFTKESIDIPVDQGISGAYVTRVLERVGQFRGGC